MAATIEPQRPALKHLSPSITTSQVTNLHGVLLSLARNPTFPTAWTISSTVAFPSSKYTIASFSLKLTSAFFTPLSPSRALLTMEGQPPQVMPSIRSVIWLSPVVSTASLPDPQPTRGTTKQSDNTIETIEDITSPSADNPTLAPGKNPAIKQLLPSPWPAPATPGWSFSQQTSSRCWSNAVFL